MIKSMINWFKTGPLTPERPMITCDDVVMDERMLSELSPEELIYLKNDMNVMSSVFSMVLSEYQIRLLNGPRKVES